MLIRVDVRVKATNLQTEIAAGDVDLFTTNDDNLLARDDLLGYGRSQSAEEMAFAIDNDRCGRHLGHLVKALRR